MKILEFAFVGYPVTDLKRTRSFYEETLGLKPGFKMVDGDKGWIEFEVGPHTLALSNTAEDWKPSGNGAAVALEVDDFDEAVRQLKEKGVRFEMEPFASPVCRIAIICDPDGNRIAIHKRNPGREE